MDTNTAIHPATDAIAIRKLSNSHRRARVPSPSSPLESISARSAREIKLRRIKARVAMIPGHQYLNGGPEPEIICS